MERPPVNEMLLSSLRPFGYDIGSTPKIWTEAVIGLLETPIDLFYPALNTIEAITLVSKLTDLRIRKGPQTNAFELIPMYCRLGKKVMAPRHRHSQQMKESWGAYNPFTPGSIEDRLQVYEEHCAEAFNAAAAQPVGDFVANAKGVHSETTLFHNQRRRIVYLGIINPTRQLETAFRQLPQHFDDALQQYRKHPVMQTDSLFS